MTLIGETVTFLFVWIKSNAALSSQSVSQSVVETSDFQTVKNSLSPHFLSFYAVKKAKFEKTLKAQLKP